MALLEFIAVAAVGGIVTKKVKRAIKKNQDDINATRAGIGWVPKTYDYISEEQFDIFAKRAGKKIRRVTDITTENYTVYGTVQSQSGMSEWDFRIEFGYNGDCSDKYWVYSDNDDSEIPNRVARIILEMIRAFPGPKHKEERIADNDIDVQVMTSSEDASKE